MAARQVERFLCPVCGLLLGPWPRGITLHAQNHAISSQDLFNLVKKIIEPPKCVCKPSCWQLVTWHGWVDGYDTYAKGHYDDKVRSQNTIEQLKKEHWSRGQTKETNETLERMSKKISTSLKVGFANGEIKHWAAGLTKANHPSLASRSEKMKGKKLHFYDAEKLTSLLKTKLEDRFTLLTTDKMLFERDSNKDCLVQIQCTRCLKTSELTAYNVVRKVQQLCASCDRWSSTFETEIGDFIESLGFKVIRRSLVDGYEIDIIVKDKMLGIECNGLYWHSVAVQPNKNHHQNKTDACNLAGLKLIHVFEDEWRDKRQIIEGMIKSRLGLNSRIFARKCMLKVLDVHARREFFTKNHIDGDVKSTVCFGLMIGNTVVAALSLRRPRANDHDVIEIARFASLPGFTVSGGLSKLLAHAVRWIHTNAGANRLLTYVDTRYGDGHAYESVGFKLDHLTSLRFWWTDKTHRYDRMVFRAHNGTSEAQIAKQNKVFRIYGCVNKAYYLKVGGSPIHS